MKNVACLFPLMMFIGFSCGGVRDVCDCGVPDNYSPTVRLVKDTDRSFHFQWDDNLLEERIVLARYTYTNISSAGAGFEPLPLELHRFAPGQFRSELLVVYDRDFEDTQSVTVEILPARDRLTLKLPHRVLGGNTVLVEHPFKHYDVGTPAKLTFSRKDKSQ